jgi:dihydrofolate reductase
MMISIICALGLNRAIGRDNNLLWHIPKDLKRFKKLTLGHPMVMGRKTYQSIGRPLPGRTNVVITHNAGFNPVGCIVCHSVQEAVRTAQRDEASDPSEIFVIGGGRVFEQTIGIADRLYLTIVEDSPENADTFFPDYGNFRETGQEGPFSENGLTFRFVDLEREFLPRAQQL